MYSETKLIDQIWIFLKKSLVAATAAATAVSSANASVANKTWIFKNSAANFDLAFKVM